MSNLFLQSSIRPKIREKKWESVCLLTFFFDTQRKDSINNVGGARALILPPLDVATIDSDQQKKGGNFEPKRRRKREKNGLMGAKEENDGRSS